MKKLLVLVFVLASTVMAYSQAQFALGLKAGVNLSKIDDNASDNITAFNGGAFALIKFANIGIQPEFLFSQQGSKFSDVQYDELKTSYVLIPIMVKFYLIGGLNVQVGPQFGFLTAAELDGDDIKKNVDSSDLSANLGLGWDLPFGLTVDARYNLGLKDVKFDPGTGGEGSFKSRVIQVSLGYKIFKFGK